MHCTNCGQEIANNAAVCTHCGVAVGQEKKFCANCGQAVNANQTICLGCGCAIATNRPNEQNKSVASLVLGLVGLIAWFIPLFGAPVSIVGLVLGVRKKYTTGIVLNVIGLVLTVANAAIGAYQGATGQYPLFN
ncbi:MAG: zinc ribbon domain-containing protein [Lentisphaeria bacterium]|nr:zinc ribbon domain-containing protein [Lentisphaeria bacterium]